jgi:hypothetical protein
VGIRTGARSTDRLRALHVLRRLVVTQRDEFRVAQMVHVGPVRVLYLRDKLRLQPAAFGHLVGCETLTPLALLALRQVRKGAGFDLQLAESLEHLHP